MKGIYLCHNDICYSCDKCSLSLPNWHSFCSKTTKFNATSVYGSGQMVLGNNVKHLVIVIPDEGIMAPAKKMKLGLLLSHFFPNMP